MERHVGAMPLPFVIRQGLSALLLTIAAAYDWRIFAGLVAAAAVIGFTLETLSTNMLVRAAIAFDRAFAQLDLVETEDAQRESGNGAGDEESGGTRTARAAADWQAVRRTAAMANADFSALAYGWGALALTGMYGLTSLSWYHAHQYAAGMALLAIVAILMRLALERTEPGARRGRLLALADLASLSQLVVAIGGVVLLLASGKVGLGRSDWAANAVFLSLGASIAGISIIALMTSHRLARARAGRG